MEEKVIYHFSHEHPLILTENVGNYKETLHCYGCRKPVISDSVYVCSQQYCSSTSILHKRCAEMPRQIFHPSHPHHPLHLFDRPGYRCNLCRCHFKDVLRYRCHSCDFDIDISCQQLDIDDLLEEKRLQHPSHHHPLTLIRKPAFLFYCHGCGTVDQDMAYVCSRCEFWIHKTCASLPITIPTNLHHHKLSLAFCFPFEYRNFEYKCDVCRKEFCNKTDWVCYCGDCRYFAHVKCATSSETTEEIIPAESNFSFAGPSASGQPSAVPTSLAAFLQQELVRLEELGLYYRRLLALIGGPSSAAATSSQPGVATDADPLAFSSKKGEDKDADAEDESESSGSGNDDEDTGVAKTGGEAEDAEAALGDD